MCAAASSSTTSHGSSLQSRNLQSAVRVYRHMIWAIAIWLIPLAALAQQTRPIEPFAAAHNAYGEAHNEGRFEDAARYREEARRLLAKVPSDAPPLAGWAASVADIYSRAGMLIDARSILEETLDRVPAGIASCS